MRTRLVAVVLSLLSMPSLAAQEAAPPEPPASRTPRPEAAKAPRPASVPLKVQVTISRFEGERRALSLPYTLLVNATDRDRGERTSLRMGIDVPVRMGPSAVDKDGKPGPSYQFRSVGTRIDCRSMKVEEGYQLELTVEQSSLNNPSERASLGTTDLPILRSFNTSFVAVLRDGQSVTTVAATDPVSGESVRIEVSLNVVR